MEKALEVTCREQIYGLKMYEEFTIGGMLYKVVAPYDEKTDSLMAAVYKDYPLGGFDYNNILKLDLSWLFGDC